jgi:O-antigen ligase
MSELLGQEAVDINDTERVDLLREGIAGIRAAPISGYGTGASWGSPFLPHNELIAVWLDNGIVGIVLYVSALGLLVTSCFRKEKALLVGCVPLLAAAPFSHNLLENKSYLFCWVILAGLLPAGRQSERLPKADNRARRAGARPPETAGPNPPGEKAPAMGRISVLRELDP